MSDRYERSKIEQSERAQEIFDPEGYAKRKAEEAKIIAELTAPIPQKHPRCPECGSIMRVRDSMLHTVPTVHCKCGYADYV